MIEMLAKKMYESIVEGGMTFYKKTFEATECTDFKEQYWIRAIEFFRTLSNDEKEVFYEIVKTIIEDSTTHTLGLLEGVASLADGGIIDSEIKVNGVSTDHLLMEYFLMTIEEHEFK